MSGGASYAALYLASRPTTRSRRAAGQSTGYGAYLDANASRNTSA